MTILKVEGGFFLPPKRNFTTSFMADVFSRKKLLLLENEVVRVKDFIGFRELTMINLFESYTKKELLLKYLPN